MKLIYKLLIVFSFLYAPLFAIEYTDVEEISLKKDVQKKILVKYDNNVRVFQFRWTLYTNEGLVLLRSYDKQVGQNILYLNHTNQSFILYLMERGVGYNIVPYLIVKFKKFNKKTNEAVFDLFLSDKKSQIELEYVKND